MYAIILYLGEGWTGGEIEFPQLGISIPTRPGTVVGGLARKLAHRATKADGNCLVITCFIDHSTFERAKAVYPSMFSLIAD